MRHLHLGHLAKAFALREAPSAVTGAQAQAKKAKAKAALKSARKPRGARGDDDETFDVGDAEKRMEKVVREQGRLTKKGGKMVSSGTGEFQLAGGDYLERLANR